MVALIAEVALGGLSGAVIVLGALLIVAGLRGGPETGTALAGRARGWRDAAAGVLASRRRLALCITAGLVVAMATSWLVAGIAAGLAGWWLPGMMKTDAAVEAHIARVEAVASFTEMVRDTLSAAAGLERTVLAACDLAPAAIAAPAAALAGRIRAGQQLPEALAAFGEDLADPTADQVVMVLIYAATRPVRDLAALLSELAVLCRDQVALVQRTRAEQARVHSSVRMVIGTIVGMAVMLWFIDAPYLAPYGTATGEIVLAVVVAILAAVLGGLAKLSRPEVEARVLARPVE